MEINKRILIAFDGDGDFATDMNGEFLSPSVIKNTIDGAARELRQRIVDEGESPDDFTLVEYKAVQQYVSEPKWIPVR